MEAKVQLQDVYKIAGIGPIPVGKVTSGTLKVGMKLNLQGNVVTLKTIEMHHNQLQQANEGDSIGLTLSGGDYDTFKSLTGQIIVFSDDGRKETAIPMTQNPTKPEGSFSFITKLFGKS